MAANPLHNWKSDYNLQLVLHSHSSASKDSTNLKSRSTVVFTFEKKSVYKWTLIVWTHVV